MRNEKDKWEIYDRLQSLYPAIMYNKTFDEVIKWLDKQVKTLSDRKIETTEVKYDKCK